MTMPLVEPIIAIDVLLVVQLPPVVLLLSVAVEPAHAVVEPLIAPGNDKMVTVAVCIQPVDATTYEIVAVPADIPVTTPLPDPMVAIVASLLLHVPVLPTTERVVVVPTHAVA